MKKRKFLFLLLIVLVLFGCKGRELNIHNPYTYQVISSTQSLDPKFTRYDLLVSKKRCIFCHQKWTISIVDSMGKYTVGEQYVIELKSVFKQDTIKTQ